MQCKCNANAFRIFHIIANASKFNANASVFYANALLLQDIKEIYIISLYIPFHYIYRERGKIPFRPQNRDKFQRICIFLAPFQKFIVHLQCSIIFKGGARTANIIRWRYFYTLSETYNGIVPPWYCLMAYRSAFGVIEQRERQCRFSIALCEKQPHPKLRMVNFQNVQIWKIQSKFLRMPNSGKSVHQ